MAEKKSGKSGKKLSEVVSDIYKKHDPKREVEMMDTGSEILNAVISGGRGVPRGAFIDLTASFGVGKSTTLLYVCRRALSQGHSVFYLDVEQGVNNSQLKGIGLSEYVYDEEKNPNGKFFLLSPRTFKEAEELFQSILEIDEPPAMVVLDSITSLMPSKTTEVSVEDSLPGIHARMTTNFLNIFKFPFVDRGITVWMINQVRNKINFGRPASVEGAGGFAYKHAMDVMLKLDVVKKLEKKMVDNLSGATATGSKDTVPYGAVVKVHALKNRFAPPYRAMQMAIYFGKGVSNLYSYTEFLERAGLIKVGGAGWTKIWLYGEDQEPAKIQSAAKVEEYLKENIDRVIEIVRDMGGFKLETDAEEEEAEKPTDSNSASSGEVSDDFLLGDTTDVVEIDVSE